MEVTEYVINGYVRHNVRFLSAVLVVLYFRIVFYMILCMKYRNINYSLCSFNNVLGHVSTALIITKTISYILNLC